MWPIWWVKTKLVELRQRCIMYSHVDWPLPCICCYNFILLPRQSTGTQGKSTSSNHTLWDKLCPRKHKNLHAVYFVWDTWPEAEVAILQMSVFLGATDKPAKTAHTATAKGQPNSLSEASLWRGLRFPARMMFLQQEIHLTWLNCNFGKVKVNLETTLQGQRLSPRQAGLCRVAAGPAGAYMWFQNLALLVLLCCSLRIRRHMHISHNVPYFPTQILHNLCFSFFLGIIAVPREIENNAYAKVWGGGVGGGGAEKVHYGRCASGLLRIQDLRYLLVSAPIPPNPGQVSMGYGECSTELLQSGGAEWLALASLPWLPPRRFYLSRYRPFLL